LWNHIWLTIFDIFIFVYSCACCFLVKLIFVFVNEFIY